MNWALEQQTLENSVETGYVLTLMDGSGSQPGIGDVISGEGLVGAQFAQRRPLSPQLGLFHARRGQQRTHKAKCFEYRRRMDENPRMRHQPPKARNYYGLQLQLGSLTGPDDSLLQPVAGGRVMRMVATRGGDQDVDVRCRRLSILIGGIQQCLVAQGIEPGNQPALAAVDGQANGFGGSALGAQTQLQAFFDQARQTGVLLCRQCLGLGQQYIVQIKRSLHGLCLNGVIQISVFNFPAVWIAIARLVTGASGAA